MGILAIYILLKVPNITLATEFLIRPNAFFIAGTDIMKNGSAKLLILSLYW